MRYCLWCMAGDLMTLTSYTIEHRGNELPVCQSHYMLEMWERQVCY